MRPAQRDASWFLALLPLTYYSGTDEDATRYLANWAGWLLVDDGVPFLLIDRNKLEPARHPRTSLRTLSGGALARAWSARID